MNISAIIPVYNSSSTLKECLEALYASDIQPSEVIVVNDSSADESREIAQKFPVKILELPGGPFGPACARNHGAEIAQSEVLFFLDSDVVILSDTFSKLVHSFEMNPSTAAIFGSYDENPSQRDFLSQYKNLIHHFIHQNGIEQAETFWSGCGAVRRDIFLELGGFDSQLYRSPSIEDIDFGYRLRAAGYSIRLQKDLQVKHLKRWSLKNLIKTDIINRAVPWTSLILRQKNLPNTLNLSLTQRIATVLLMAMLFHLALFVFQPNLLVLPILTILFMLCAASWNWNDGAPQLELNGSLEKSIFLMIAAIILLALWNGQAQLIAPFVIFLPLFLLTLLFANATKPIRNFLYVSMSVVFAVEYVMLFASYPILFTFPLLIYLMLIILLNQRLYIFLFHKRGILFAFAALPLQLLYYFYSFITFIVVSLLHIWNVRFDRQQSHQ